MVATYGFDDGGQLMLLPIDGSAPVVIATGDFGLADVQRLAP